MRFGDIATLRWTMPKKTTDHLPLAGQIQGPIPVSLCLRLKPSGPCQPIGAGAFAAGSEVSMQQTLPTAETTGQPRQLLLFVELRNKAGKSAGLSNSAVVAGGAVPAPVSGLTAEVRASGVALHWDQESPDAPASAVRLHRTLLTPPTKPAGAPLPAAPTGTAPSTGKTPSPRPSSPFSNNASEPVERDLLVDPAHVPDALEKNPGALDSTASFGQVYQYTAQRTISVKIDGQLLELDGQVSAPVKVSVIDIFPPAVPQELAAVADAQGIAIDLSWQPNTEKDLAGYIVYRTEPAATGWQRVSGPQPLPTATFRDTMVQPGRSYRYAVSAIDQTGHESKPSVEAEETMPKD